ncbi:MAG: hypothetical protein KKE23_00395 [Nanoarchaeota archaeon]|nr:hypothetical protein [Nanoarchaeota archaeon]
MVDETPVEDVLKMTNAGMNDAEIIRRLTDEGFSPVQISDALNQAKIKQEIAPAGIQQPPQNQQPVVQQPMAPLPPPMPPVQAQSQIPRPSAQIPRPTAVPPQMSSQTKPASLEEQAYPYPYTYPSYPTYPQSDVAPQKIDTEAIEEIAEEIVNEKWLEIKGKISDVIEWKNYAEKRIDSIDERLKRLEVSFDRLQAALLSKVQEYGRDIKDLGSEIGSLENAFGKILNPLVENVKALSKITEEIKRKTPASAAVAKKIVKKA